MSKYSSLFILILFLVSCHSDSEERRKGESYTDFVDPFIGTGGHGHTFPGATLPFGMMQLSPDTRLDGWDGCGGYHYTDDIVYGFSHTHLSGTGVSDYGDVLLKPCVGLLDWESGYGTPYPLVDSYASRFDKEQEVARPGYYRTMLEEGIEVELTTGLRAGMHRYTFHNPVDAHVVLDLMHRDMVLDCDIQIREEDRLITGYRRSSAWAQDQHVYFAMEFDTPFVNPFIKQETITPYADSTKKVNAKAVFGFVLSDTTRQQVQLRIGISSVDINGALKNLRAEADDWDFDAMRERADSTWNKELQKIHVYDEGRAKDKTVFYTSLYHSMIAPNLYSDVDGRYRKTIPKVESERADQQTIAVVPPGDRQYTVFSLWDTYRATHPLYTIIDEKRTSEFIRTFLRQYNDGGQLPVWELASTYTGCMIGYHSVSVISDAHAKGISDFDEQLAMKAMKHSAQRDELGIDIFNQKGFLNTGDEPESVSKTLEYAYDDWCIAEYARRIGDDANYQTYIDRAQYYKNLFNPENNFLQGRRNGGWYGPFRPEEVNFNYTEANGWQYSLAVPQDVNTLIDYMGGDEAFIAHLDQMFAAPAETSGRHQVDITGLIGQYAHGNEPSHHMAYLYAYAGQPWKTQKYCSQIMDSLYWAAPDGLSGNEDCGQMSSWYVLSAMGFYPVCPGSTDYVFGTPQFSDMRLDLENGKTFAIRADALEKGPYIQSVRLNGKAYSKSYINHDDIQSGGELVFVMGSEPNTAFGKKVEDRPQQRISENLIAVNPSITADSRVFENLLEVRIKTPQKGARIYYTTDGSIPSRKSTEYTSPITLRQTSKVRAIAMTDVMSKVVDAEFFKIEGGRSITLNSAYANQYAAGGDNALIDMIKGGAEFTTGDWQGYREDLDVTIDLGEVKEIKRIALGCNQNIKSWIWFPKEVTFEFAYRPEGDFRPLARIVNDYPDDEYGALIKRFEKKVTGLKARYIRVRAKQYGKCPDWHLGAGGKTWIFADEIEIE